MQKLMCELCRSNNFTKDDDGFFVCDYCRTKYTPAQAKSLMVEGTVKVDRSEDALNLVRLSHSAFETGNYQESYDYANRALEIDAENIEAWILKGACCGVMPNPQERRLTEMQNAFGRAVEYAAEEEQSTIRRQCTAKALHVGDVAVAQGDLQSALDFAAVALGIDPESPEAWYAKGACAGSLSTIKDRRFDEMVHAFERAIEHAGASEEEMRQRCAAKAMTIALRLNESGEVGLLYGRVDAYRTHTHYTCTQESLTVLATCYQWTNSREPLDHYLAIVSKLHSGIPLVVSRGGKSKRVITPLPLEYKRHLRSQFDWARSRIIEIDPSFGIEPTKTPTTVWSVLRRGK